MDGVPLIQRLASLVPHWLAWPLSALSTIGALGGAALVFFAAVYGEYVTAAWGGVAFVVSAGLWYLADFAAGNRPV